MKKFALSLVALLTLALSAGAQTVEKIDEFAGFSEIEVSNFFEVKICYSETFSTKITVDQMIADNVQSFVKGNTLYLKVDEKNYSPEVKKLMKGKNAVVPFLRAEIYLPTVAKIKIGDKVVLYSEDNLKADVLQLTAANNSNVKNLVFDAKDVKVTLSNKATGRFDVYTNDVQVEASNNSSAIFAINCSSATIATAGSGNVTMSGEFKNIAVKGQGSSTVTLSGNASKISVDGSNNSNCFSDGLVVKDADIVLSNTAVCEINAKENLKVDLTGSSHLIFNGSPAVDVTRIISSSMTRSGDTKSKKK